MTASILVPVVSDVVLEQNMGISCIPKCTDPYQQTYYSNNKNKDDMLLFWGHNAFSVDETKRIRKVAGVVDSYRLDTRFVRSSGSDADL